MDTKKGDPGVKECNPEYYVNNENNLILNSVFTTACTVRNVNAAVIQSELSLASGSCGGVFVLLLAVALKWETLLPAVSLTASNTPIVLETWTHSMKHHTECYKTSHCFDNTTSCTSGAIAAQAKSISATIEHLVSLKLFFHLCSNMYKECILWRKLPFFSTNPQTIEAVKCFHFLFFPLVKTTETPTSKEWANGCTTQSFTLSKA